MSRIFGLAFALLFAIAPGSPARADSPLPDQVVQGIADDLGKAIEGHQAELRADRERLIDMIDGILLPHFDIDYASILVLGQHARAATPAQRSRFARVPRRLRKAVTRRGRRSLRRRLRRCRLMR